MQVALVHCFLYDTKSNWSSL